MMPNKNKHALVDDALSMRDCAELITGFTYGPDERANLEALQRELKTRLATLGGPEPRAEDYSADATNGGE